MTDQGNDVLSGALRDYQLYDRNVDIVSAFEWFFTLTSDMPRVVAHFERYPTIRVRVGTEMRQITPDFTVLFVDGTAWVAEIANISLQESSVDKLCAQLQNYSLITEVPGRDGARVPVSGVDVVFFTPITVGADAAHRVFSERFENAEHPYKPAERPVLVQFAQQPDEYVFQPWPDRTQNGYFRPHGEGQLLEMSFRQLKMKPGFFAATKVKYAFCNDPVPPLYLATRLVMSVFPALKGNDPGNAFETTTVDVLAELRRQYGHGRVADVTKALELLRSAALVSTKDGNTWRVLRSRVSIGDDDVHRSILARVGKAAKPKPKRTPTIISGAVPLFDSPEALEQLVKDIDEDKTTGPS